MRNPITPGVASILRTGVREFFVPKGLDEGSQAIYCLGGEKKR
jgi:hypothetical protein